MEKRQDAVIKSNELGWYKRAQHKSAEPYESTLFHEDKMDFLPELMPLDEHPLWNAVSDSTKRMVASYGWVMYNMRTISIETKVVSPLCYSIIENKNQLTEDFDCRRIVTQTLVDESYHTLLSIEGIKGIVDNRNLPEIELPEQNFIKEYNCYLTECGYDWQKDIAQMALVVSSEVLISDYLSSIATSESIQPLCRQVTRTHWKDELAHANVFKLIAEKIMSKLTAEKKEFMIECVIKASGWFANKELESWGRILTFVGVSRADEIIDDCRAAPEKPTNLFADKKIKFLIDLLKNSQYKNDRFTQPLMESVSC